MPKPPFHLTDRNAIDGGRAPAREPFYVPFEDEQDGLGLRDCWLVVRKRLWLLIGIVVSVVLLAGIYTVEKTPLYSATAVVLLKPAAPQVLNVPQLQAVDIGTDQHDYYKTQYALAKSPELAGQVIRKLGLESNPLFAPPKAPQGFVGEVHLFLSHLIDMLEYPWANRQRPDEAALGDLGIKQSTIRAYLSRLVVAPVFGTQLMDITYTTPDPTLSARIANAHALAYIDRGLDLRRRASEIVRTFLGKQLSAIGQRVQQSEAALNNYRHKMGILSFQTKNANQIAETRMAELQKALADAETNRIRLGAEMQLIRSRNYVSLPDVISNRTVQVLEPEIDRLAAQYAGMVTRFTGRWPALAEVKVRLDAARTQLEQEIATVTEGVRREYQAAVLREDRLRSLVSAEKERDFASNDAALKDAILARRVETNRELYRTVLKRIQEVGIADQGPISNATIATAASVPRSPSYPKVFKNLGIAGVGGILIGLAMVFALDKMDTRFKNVEEIERDLKLPKFALIPDFRAPRLLLPGPETAADARRVALPASRRRKGDRAEIMRLLHSPAYTKHYRPLHMALQFSRAGGSPKLVMFTSAIPQEGKTVSAAGAAFATSGMGGRTLLVDADLHRRQCQNLVATEDPVGLSDVLAGRRGLADAVHGSAGGLFVLPAGSHAPNPAALLASEAMRELLSSLEQAFDHVFLDTPPVLAASETIALATMVDGVVLVIGSDAPRKAVLDAHTALRRAGATVLGFLFNRVDLRLPQHRSYHRYSGYEAYYDDADSTNGGGT